MKYLLAILITMLPAGLLQAQYQGQVYQYNGNSVPVYQGTQQKSTPWCGGFDNPQLSMGDLNQDGKTDLVIFERNPAIIKTFINTGTAGSPYYTYEPSYALNFPSAGEYLYLHDYNDDSIPDMFSHNGIYGFTVYKGYYNTNNELAFNFYRVLTYSNDLSSIPPVDAYVKNNDMPSIIDVDNDGDLDFFAYNADGAQIYFYQNYQVEDGLPPDSIRIRLRDRCWGKISQGITRTHLMNYFCDNSNLLRPAGGVRDGNNAICLFDADGDNDYDLLDGNVSFPDIQYFRNGRVQVGTSVDTMVFQDTIWEQHTLPKYPAAFYIDIDQDGKKDIIATPHAEGLSENYKTMHFFRNTGTITAPIYTFVSDTLVVDQAIDAGTGSYPQLYDYDKDGKPDLIVGSDGYYQNGLLRSRLSYYRNTSTGPGSPSFEYQTDNLIQVDTMDLKGAAPAMGDINNDGKDDLILGQSDGTLTLYVNTAASNNVQPVWSNPVIKLRDSSNVNNPVVIDVGSNAAPFVYDVDKDGKPDLVIGTFLGYFVYYQNVGTVAGQVRLKRINTRLGYVKADPQIVYKGYSTPFIGRIDDINEDYLLSGSSTGRLYRYTGFQTGDTAVTYTALDTMYSFINQHGVRTSPTVADIDGDGKYDMVVGNQFGGLMMYRQMVNVSVKEHPAATLNEQDVKLYPNPARNELNISWNNGFAEKNVDVQIVDAMGQKVFHSSYDASAGIAVLHIEHLVNGMYFCTIKSQGKQAVKKLTVIR